MTREEVAVVRLAGKRASVARLVRDQGPCPQAECRSDNCPLLASNLADLGFEYRKPSPATCVALAEQRFHRIYERLMGWLPAVKPVYFRAIGCIRNTSDQAAVAG